MLDALFNLILILSTQNDSFGGLRDSVEELPQWPVERRRFEWPEAG